MPSFGKSSEEKLNTTHPDLQRLFREVVKHFDCTIICGHRGKEEQERACAEGNSKVHWPNGKHNAIPSNAVDVMPYPVNWSEDAKNIEQITLFAGFVLGMAKAMGINIRWGHDWDMDLHPDKRGLIDRPHYELKGG